MVVDRELRKRERKGDWLTGMGARETPEKSEEMHGR